MINFKLTAEIPSYMNDVPEVIRAFSPYIVVSEEGTPFIIKVVSDERELDFFVKDGDAETYFNTDIKAFAARDGEDLKRKTKAWVKERLYSYCNKITGVNLPYGCLTGVRPTAVYYRSIGSYSNIKEHLINDYFVEEKRADLIERVVETQKGYIVRDPHRADVFVNIPICPTRCSYCSFISAELNRIRKIVPKYVSALLKDISDLKKEMADKGYIPGAVYIGGGTPTSLDAEALDRITAELNFGGEFTVEAGRPDTMTEDKLEVFRRNGVTRVSVNPQTFSDETLVRIGRKHTVADFYAAFDRAKSLGFDINIDLIAGLPGEVFDDFKNSLNRAVELRPQNLTVHSLSLKRGAVLKEQNVRVMDGSVKEMCDYSIDTLLSAGYSPYYMYRQKNIADGLENVGYSLPGHINRYNIDYMEETTTVLSAGAGSVTKYVYSAEGRIERKSKAKGIEEYIRRTLGEPI